jgi:EAL domain-containing protein (putative c-di-GMP-specific phosphodiesterase class I)/CheY-like chemotaxis protein
MILEVGAWVLRSVAAQQHQWTKTLGTPLQISVNLSARQLNANNLIEMLEQTLESTGVDPRHMELELTESMLARDGRRTRELLERITKLGFPLAIDDFGTGYSSLSYLRQFPITALKIDQSFVRDIVSDPNSLAIARSIKALADSLNMVVIAEGVETAAQLAVIQHLNCDQIQGFYFSKPIPLEQFEALLIEAPHYSLPQQHHEDASTTLLIVDDEPNIATAIRRSLRHEGYRILSAQTVTEAFELMATESVGVVVSDQRMPQMSGTVFLHRIHDLYPQTVRIMLTGYTDLETLTEAVNEAYIYKFLTKPWDDEQLRTHIRAAFALYREGNTLPSQNMAGL